MDQMGIDRIQAELKRLGLDGWLMYDFHGHNDIAVRFLGLKGIITRRSLYFIPAAGTPTTFAHAIERTPTAMLPGRKFYYSSYRLLEEELRRTLAGIKRLAMEYSPMGRLPYIAKVDAGTVELVKSFGIEVVTSADLVARFDACLSAEQIALHREAAGHLNRIKDEAFALIARKLSGGELVTEYDVARFMMERFQMFGMVTEDSPICAVGPNGGNPHYEPTSEVHREIHKGDLIVLDLWARHDRPQGVYADITWMAYAGETVPDLYTEQFAVICAARDAAVERVRSRWGKGEIFGYEVDDACRKVITDGGLGKHFIHRTGHSITDSVHGPGPNIDNLETEDRRQLLPGHLFSVEPGVYFDEYGMRTEIDVLITPQGPDVTTQPMQHQIIRLFA
jgi:Xaa-Pro aminopeptidase